MNKMSASIWQTQSKCNFREPRGHPWPVLFVRLGFFFSLLGSVPKRKKRFLDLTSSRLEGSPPGCRRTTNQNGWKWQAPRECFFKAVTLAKVHHWEKYFRRLELFVFATWPWCLDPDPFPPPTSDQIHAPPLMMIIFRFDLDYIQLVSSYKI